MEKLKMETGKWKIENGKKGKSKKVENGSKNWKMENEKWKIEVGNGKWKTEEEN